MGQYISPFGNGSASPGSSGGNAPSNTNYISPFKGSVYTADYWKQKQQEDQQQQNQDKQVNDLKNLGSLSYNDQIKAINTAAKSGIIKKDDQMKMINDAVDGNAPKIPDLNPIQQFVAGAAGTGQRVLTTLGAAAQGIKTLGQAAADKITGNKDYQANLNANASTFKGLLSAPDAVDGGRGSFLSYEQAQAKNGDIVGNFIKPIANAAGEVVPYVAPYGAISKFAAPAAESVTAKFLATAAGKALSPTAAKVASKVIQAGTEGAAQAPLFAGSNAATQYGTNGNVDIGQAIGQGVVGGLGAGVIHGIGSVFAKGPEAHLAFKAKNGETNTLMPEVTPGQFHGTFVDPHKVSVDGGDTKSTDVGVTSPLKVGVKDVSNTSNVEVRTVPKMTDQQYTKQFNALSKSYDSAQKGLADMPPLRQKAAAQAIDERHAQALNALDEAYANPQLPDGTSKIKTTSKSTTKAPDNTGGTPKGFVNTTGQMSELENTLFTAAKNKAEKRLGRDLNQQEVSNLFNSTKKVVAEKMPSPATETPVPSLPETVSPAEPTPAPPVAEPTPPVPTAETHQAVEPPISSQPPKAEAVPANPPTEGDTVSGNSTRIQQVALEKKLTNTMGDLPQYKSLNMKDQAKQALDLVTNDRQKAIDIVDGKANPPDGIHPQAVHQALEVMATKEGNGELLTKLAKSHINTELSEGAQKLRLAAERDPNSPVEQIRQLRESRVKMAEKRSGTTVAKETAKASTAVKASTRIASKQDLANFIKELTC
jgi:hypothetical protein